MHQVIAFDWAAWYNTWLLVELTSKGVVFHFIFSFLFAFAVKDADDVCQTLTSVTVTVPNIT